MHGVTWEQKRDNVTAIVEFLLDRGYDSIFHVESGAFLDRSNAGEIAAEGHLFCKKSKEHTAK